MLALVPTGLDRLMRLDGCVRELGEANPAVDVVWWVVGTEGRGEVKVYVGDGSIDKKGVG